MAGGRFLRQEQYAGESLSQFFDEFEIAYTCNPMLKTLLYITLIILAGIFARQIGLRIAHGQRQARETRFLEGVRYWTRQWFPDD